MSPPLGLTLNGSATLSNLIWLCVFPVRWYNLLSFIKNLENYKQRYPVAGRIFP